MGVKDWSPENITAEHIREAAKQWDKNGGFKDFKPSLKYDVIIDGKRYPPKAISSIAHKLANKKKKIIKPSEFAGAKNGIWHKMFKGLNFKVVPKNNDSSGIDRVPVPGSRVDHVEIEEHNTEVFPVYSASTQREAKRGEAMLVKDFLLNKGFSKVSRLRITPEGEASPVFSDLYIPSEKFLIEAKGSVDRWSIRMAIGQLLDYRRFEDIQKMAILVPSRPSTDIINLVLSVGIELYWKEGSNFEHLSKMTVAES